LRHLQLLFRYLKYRWHAKSRHDIHSPFLYAFVDEVLGDDRSFYAFREITALRQKLLVDETPIPVRDLGAGSQKEAGIKRKISTIARHAAISRKHGELLFRIVHYYQQPNILEMGTSFALRTAYLALARKKARVITLEGCPNCAAKAQAHFETLEADNIRLLLGPFDETLPRALHELPRLDLAYFDGNHRKAPTLRYFRQCLKKAHPGTIFIFDDIHWSQEMEAAWAEICLHEKVTISLDLFRWGIVFFKNGIARQHQVLRF